jgi:O-acetyl-ADP-ribose deacetylase (regulator of RNase III)
VWRGGKASESSVLASAYRNVLGRAAVHGLRTIAFPAISTGAYGYPADQAAWVAVSTVRDVVEENAGAFDEIRFVVFSDADLQTYRTAASSFDWTR